MLLFQDNVPVHTAPVAIAEAANCGFELLPHRSDSSDFAPSDFFMFPKLKSHLRSPYFGINDEAICTVEEFWVDKNTTFFQEWIAMLEHHWSKCIDIKCDFMEK